MCKRTRTHTFRCRRGNPLESKLLKASIKEKVFPNVNWGFYSIIKKKHVSYQGMPLSFVCLCVAPPIGHEASGERGTNKNATEENETLFQICFPACIPPTILSLPRRNVLHLQKKVKKTSGVTIIITNCLALTCFLPVVDNSQVISQVSWAYNK